MEFCAPPRNLPVSPIPQGLPGAKLQTTDAKGVMPLQQRCGGGWPSGINIPYLSTAKNMLKTHQNGWISVAILVYRRVGVSFLCERYHQNVVELPASIFPSWALPQSLRGRFCINVEKLIRTNNCVQEPYPKSEYDILNVITLYMSYDMHVQQKHVYRIDICVLRYVSCMF